MNHWYVPRMIIACFMFVDCDGLQVQLNILGFARRVKWYRVVVGGGGGGGGGGGNCVHALALCVWRQADCYKVIWKLTSIHVASDPTITSVWRRNCLSRNVLGALRDVPVHCVSASMRSPWSVGYRFERHREKTKNHVLRLWLQEI